MDIEPIGECINDQALVDNSKAISLKRQADALERIADSLEVITKANSEQLSVFVMDFVKRLKNLGIDNI